MSVKRHYACRFTAVGRGSVDGAVHRYTPVSSRWGNSCGPDFSAYLHKIILPSVFGQHFGHSVASESPGYGGKIEAYRRILLHQRVVAETGLCMPQRASRESVLAVSAVALCPGPESPGGYQRSEC